MQMPFLSARNAIVYDRFASLQAPPFRAGSFNQGQPDYRKNLPALPKVQWRAGYISIFRYVERETRNRSI
jgi:hypothetical protein